MVDHALFSTSDCHNDSVCGLKAVPDCVQSLMTVMCMQLLHVLHAHALRSPLIVIVFPLPLVTNDWGGARAGLKVH